MKLEDQCCSKQQAESLKKLGIIQKSIFYYHPAFIRPTFGETWTTKWGTQYKKTLVCNDKNASASAFMVAELGVMLPGGYDTMYTTDEGWRGYDHDGNDFQVESFKTEAECRAEMLIHLLEQNIVTAEECNKRITES